MFFNLQTGSQKLDEAFEHGRVTGQPIAFSVSGVAPGTGGEGGDYAACGGAWVAVKRFSQASCRGNASHRTHLELQYTLKALPGGLMKKTITATMVLAVGLALSGCGEVGKTAAQTPSAVTTSPASQAKLDNYVGKNLKETRKLLEAAGVKVTSKAANDKTILAESNWTVAAQDPAAGQSSSSITLTATKPEATPAVTQASPEPTKSKPEEILPVEDNTCNIDENFGKCFFGQTAIYEDSRRGGNEVLLEITVQEPQKFKPGADADFVITTLGGTQEKGPDNLYFDIVIKNLSEQVVLDRSDVQLVANSATDGDFDVRSVQDDIVEHFWDAKLEPGQSSIMRSGWNFNDASEPTFKVRIDGLGGQSVTFSHK